VWFINIRKGITRWFMVCMGDGVENRLWCMKGQMGNGNYEV